MYKLPNPAAPILALENVSLSHAGRELRGVSFAAYAGRVTALIGPINAGKTSVYCSILKRQVQGRSSSVESPISGLTIQRLQWLLCPPRFLIPLTVRQEPIYDGKPSGPVRRILI